MRRKELRDTRNCARQSAIAILKDRIEESARAWNLKRIKNQEGEEAGELGTFPSDGCTAIKHGVRDGELAIWFVSGSGRGVCCCCCDGAPPRSKERPPNKPPVRPFKEEKNAVG